MPEKTTLSMEKKANFAEAHEHMKAAYTSIRQSFEDLLPKGFVEHKKAARKEMLLAMRSVIDAAIRHSGGQAE